MIDITISLSEWFKNEEYVFSKKSDEIKPFVKLAISPSEAANVCWIEGEECWSNDS